MPKSKTRRASRKTRKNLLSGKNHKKQGRKGGRRPQSNTPAIIANSIFALTLNPVPGVMVECNKSLHIGASKMYTDLLLCYHQLNVSPGAAPKLPADDLPVEHKLSALVNLIRRAIHKQVKFNIEKIDDHYCIVFYYICEYVNYLPVIQVGDALLRVKKEYTRIHDLFISFLKTFISTTKVDAWYDSIMEYGIDSLEDNIFQIDNEEGPYRDDADPEWVEEAKKDLELYKTGDAKKYEKLLLKGKRIMKAEDILKAVNRFKTKHPLLKIIKLGCGVIDPRFSMFQYGYDPDKSEGEEDDDNYALEFNNQAMIHWSFDGQVVEEYDQWVDCQANEGGIKAPICKHIIHPKSKTKFNEEEFGLMCAWPSKLVDFFSNANGILNQYLLK